MKTISLKVTGSLNESLAKVAGKRGASKSAVVREALEAYIRSEKNVQPGSCLEQARDLVGRVKGPPDLSVHKKYMKGFGK